MKKRTLGGVGKTNPKRTQTNPIKANLQNAQMNVNKVLTKEYEKKLNWALYENEPNTNPNKPNFSPKNAKTKPIQTQTKPISRAKNAAFDD